MSHIHLPDGVLPLWLVAAGWIATLGLVTFSLKRMPPAAARRGVPLVGALAALMLVAMSSEVVPIAYHINLTVLAGILLGPSLAAVTALIVVTLLALIGHGGVTVIGLNTLVVSLEMLLGGALFRLLLRRFKALPAGWSAAITTVITLFVSTSLLIGIVALGGPLAATRESGAFDPNDLRFENPFAEGLVGSELVAPETPEATQPLRLKRFALIVYALGLLGWVLEGAITAGIVGFVSRVRPSLVFSGETEERRAPLGDEGVHR